MYLTEGILEESDARKKLLLKSCVLRGIIILTGMPSISLPVKSVETVIICAWIVYTLKEITTLNRFTQSYDYTTKIREPRKQRKG